MYIGFNRFIGFCVICLSVFQRIVVMGLDQTTVRILEILILKIKKGFFSSDVEEMNK